MLGVDTASVNGKEMIFGDKVAKNRGQINSGDCWQLADIKSLERIQ
jgi:hypothetical protein